MNLFVFCRGNLLFLTFCTFPCVYILQGIIRRHSVYCLVDELRQGSLCPRRRKKNKKIKNELSYLACIGGKNKKDALKLVFYHENRQIPYNLCTFIIKISLFFFHVGGKNKKNTELPILFSHRA